MSGTSNENPSACPENVFSWVDQVERDLKADGRAILWLLGTSCSLCGLERVIGRLVVPGIRHALSFFLSSRSTLWMSASPWCQCLSGTMACHLHPCLPACYPQLALAIHGPCYWEARVDSFSCFI